MGAWDPAQYAKFEGERTQPARDLLARIPLEEAAVVADLGCGPGNSTALLRDRWPRASVIGVDNDEAMLGEARRRSPEGAWLLGNAATWAPAHPCDVLFSNATLHWIDHHAALFPRLLSHVRPGGVLAVQMPRNYADPSHTSIESVANAGPWSARVNAALRKQPVSDAPFYYDVLAPHATRVELWETQYIHVLASADAVVEWVKGTGLRPALDALEPDERPAFEERYRDAIRRAYPPSADGRVLFPF